MRAVAVNDAGHLDGVFGGQPLDRTLVGHVHRHHRRLIGADGAHDVHGNALVPGRPLVKFPPGFFHVLLADGGAGFEAEVGGVATHQIVFVGRQDFLWIVAVASQLRKQLFFLLIHHPASGGCLRANLLDRLPATVVEIHIFARQQAQLLQESGLEQRHVIEARQSLRLREGRSQHVPPVYYHASHPTQVVQAEVIEECLAALHL